MQILHLNLHSTFFSYIYVSLVRTFMTHSPISFFIFPCIHYSLVFPAECIQVETTKTDCITEKRDRLFLLTTRMIISAVELLRIHHVRRNIEKESEKRRKIRQVSFWPASSSTSICQSRVFPRAEVVALSFPSGHRSRDASEPTGPCQWTRIRKSPVRRKYYYRGKSETIPRGKRSVTFG